MRRKILLIDDDATLLSFLGEYLGDEGMEVVTAQGGAEGLRLAYREQPALVVMDVMMPEMDGWETATRLRELSDVPIIFLTAKTSEEDKLRGFQIGVDDYVTKPFSFAELSARIQAVLNRSRGSGEEDFNRVLVGDLLLDLNARELRRGGQPVALTPTEYRLLETLARHRGRAVEEAVLVQGYGVRTGWKTGRRCGATFSCCGRKWNWTPRARATF